jgi:hypothetical protein
MVTSFLVCEQKPRQHNTHREKKKEFKLEDEMQRSLRRRGGPQLYPTLTWFAFLLCTLSTGRIGVAAQIADSAVTGCWDLQSQVVFWHEIDSGVVNASFTFGELAFELPPVCEINLCKKPTVFSFRAATTATSWAGTVTSEYVPRPIAITLIRRHEHKQCVQDAKCTDNCSGHGTCVAPDVCFCHSAYSGNTCNDTLPTASPVPTAPPTPFDLTLRPPLVRKAEYDSDRRCVDGTRDADFDGITSCTERRVTGDSTRAVVAPLYNGRGWPLDSQLFVPTTAFASGVEAVDTYMLPPDAYFFADDGGNGIDPPVTLMPTPMPTGTPMPTPILVNVTPAVDALAGVPLNSADRKLLSSILAVRISTQLTAPIGVVRNTVAEYSVCLRLSETNKPPPPTTTAANTTTTTTTSTTMPPTTETPPPTPPPLDPPIEFAPPARGAAPLDQFTCIAQLVCVAGPPPAPTTTTTQAATSTAPAPTPQPSAVSCGSLTSLTCESASTAGCQYDAINGVCIKKQRRRQATDVTTTVGNVNTTTPPATPMPTPNAPAPSDLAPLMVIENIGRTNCSWQCVDGMVRGSAYAVHGMRLPYDSVCSKVKTVNTMFVVLRLEPTAVPETPTGLSGGAIAGIVIGVLAGVILIGAAAYWFVYVRDGGRGGGGSNNAQQMNNFNQQQHQQNNSNNFNNHGLPSRSPSLMNVTPTSDVQIGMYGSTRSLFSANSSMSSGSSAPAVSVPNAFKPKFSGPTSPQLIQKIENDSSYAPVPPDFQQTSRGTVVATYGAAADAASQPYGDMVLRNNTFPDGKIYGV